MLQRVESQDSSAPTATKYAGFLSYSHADEDVAQWLHTRLEKYRVPAPFSRQRASRRLGKIFRDRVDLSASHDLGRDIQNALRQSACLIVVCSKRSARSRYVNDEIRYFKSLGRADRIFAVIVDGEPYASLRPGPMPSDECFPSALIYRLMPDGGLSDSPEASEPVAADARPGKDGRDNSALKIIAGMLGVELDQLMQRERQAERARRRQAQLIASGMFVLAMCALSAGAFAWWQRGISEARRIEADVQRSAARSNEALARTRADEAERERLRAENFAAESERNRLMAETNAEEAVLQSSVAETQRRLAQDTLDRMFATRSIEANVRGEFAGAIRLALAGWHVAPSNESAYRSALGTVLHDAFESRVIQLPWQQLLDLRYSSNGAYIDVASAEAIWRIDVGGKSHRMLKYSGETTVSKVVFCGDAQRIFFRSWERFGVIDTETGKILWTLPESKSAPTRATCDLAGGKVATWQGNGNVITVRNAETGDAVHTFSKHTGKIDWVLAMPSDGAGEVFFSASGDEKWIWAVSGEAEKIADGHNGGVVASPSRKLIARSYAFDDSGNIFDKEVTISGGSFPHRVNAGSAEIADAAFSFDDAHFAVASEDGTLRVWETESGTLVSTFRTDPRLQAVAFSPKDQTMATIGDGELRIWPDRHGRRIATVPSKPGVIRWSLSEPDVLLNIDKQTLRRLKRGATAFTQVEPGYATTRVFAPSEDGTRAPVVKDDGRLDIISTRDGSGLASLDVPAGPVLSVGISADNSHLLLAYEDRRVFVTSLDGRSRLLSDGSDFPDRSRFAVSPDGQLVALAAPKAPIRIVATRSGKTLFTVKAAGDPVDRLVFSPDGTVLLIFNGSNVVLVRLSDERVLLQGRSSKLQVFSFSADGSKVVLALDDPKLATLYDLSTGRPVISFRGHDEYIEAAHLTRDGTRLFTTDDEDTTLVWDTEDGRVIGRLVVSKTTRERLYLQKKLRDAALSPDEQIFAQQSDDAVFLWDVSRLTGSISELANVACNRVLNDITAEFPENEIRADPLLAARWGDSRKDTDVCENLPGVEISRERLERPW